MRLLTWNIHKGIGGVDRRYALERTEAVIRHYRPDVLALQEVDQGVPRSRLHDQARLLAERLGFEHVAFAANVRLTRGRYGNATLSHHPITHQQNLDLTIPLKKRRAALYTLLRVPWRGHRLTVHLFNWHLGLSGMERRVQVRKLLGRRQVRQLHRNTSRIIIAGDTNDWAGALPGGALGQAGFDCVTGTARSALRTFPAWGPLGALDKVFVRGPLSATHLTRPRLDLARQASDHLPVLVDLDLGTA